MGSTNYLSKSKTYRAKSGSSGGSDREMNGKFRRTKIRRPSKMNEYGLKRIPDYTELAYKEAVSKLKYFLSGNAPSVRSYGSYTGKIEDSEGDLDKKYPYTLAEFKPKPRLTAKYTTLYADSLNNYTPPQTNAPASSAADLSGGTNPDVVNFIQKQEEYIEQLERESQYCRDELNNLLGKVKEVISENEHLHEAQKNKLISRMFHSYNEESETDDLDDIGDSTGLDSDNKVTPMKSRKTKSRTTKLEGPNIVFESRIAELEAQLAQAKIDLKKVQEENNENKRKLAAGLVDSTCLDGFKRQIDNLQRDKSTLESQISKLKMTLDQKDGDYDNRHKKSSDIIEQQLRDERNNLEAELRRLKEELSSERNKVRELTGAGARRMLQERSAAELRHNAHTEQLARDLAAQYELAAKLQLDLDRQRRDENDLKREISMKNAAIEELKIELKNKSATLQADLAQAHAEKASLEEELASARLAIERQQRQARHETNRLNSEIQSLRQRLDRADADLVHSRRENLRLSEQISTLEKELNMKNLTPISPENKKKERELSSMLESMENKHAKTVAELESMIQSQNSLMEKLTGECRLLTDKLDDANRRHKLEKTRLLCRNSELMRKLRNLWSSHKKYCTTTVAPFRSNTPLSGYPSSLSYDLDRTYSTSTPYTNRFRYKRNDYSSNKHHSASDDIDDLNANLSDLSLDKFNYSDDDVVKVRTDRMTKQSLNHLEELATLQRQIKDIGQSLQKPLHSPSTYQAPTPHVPTTDRVSNSPPSTRPDYPRSESTRDTTLAENDRLSRDHVNDHYETHVDDLQNHITDYNTETIQEPHNNVQINNRSESHKANEEKSEEFESNTSVQDTLNENFKYKDNRTSKNNYGYEQQERRTNETENLENNKDYTQSKESNENVQYTEIQPMATDERQYEEQNYDQNFEQPQYSEQYDNYEQYQQEYTDPNAQYEGQNENYQADGNYTEQNNDNIQYNQEYTSDAIQTQNNDNIQYSQDYAPDVTNNQNNDNIQYSQDYAPDVTNDQNNDNIQYSQDYVGDVTQEQNFDNQGYNPEYSETVPKVQNEANESSTHKDNVVSQS